MYTKVIFSFGRVIGTECFCYCLKYLSFVLEVTKRMRIRERAGTCTCTWKRTMCDYRYGVFSSKEAELLVGIYASIANTDCPVPA